MRRSWLTKFGVLCLNQLVHKNRTGGFGNASSRGFHSRVARRLLSPTLSMNLAWRIDGGGVSSCVLPGIWGIRFVSVIVYVISCFYLFSSCEGIFHSIQSYWSLSCDHGLHCSDGLIWEQQQQVCGMVPRWADLWAKDDNMVLAATLLQHAWREFCGWVGKRSADVLFGFSLIVP